jgi:TM2 domain-containing membrane protein YozV
MGKEDPVEPDAGSSPPGPLADTKVMARLSLERGRYDEALALFNQVLEVNPSDTEALNGKGLALLGLGRGSEARQVSALIQQIRHAPGTGSGQGPSLPKYSTPSTGSLYAPAKYNRPVRKTPVVAALCSTIIPGLGQVYNGESVKGIIVFALTLMGLVFLILPGLMVWLFSAYSAYTVAGKMNSGEYPTRPASIRAMAVFAGAAIILIIVAIAAAVYLFSLLLSG